MRKMLGLHCLGDWFNYINHIGLWKPPVITVLSPNREQIQEVKRLSPDTIIIGRLYHDDAWYNNFVQADPLGLASTVNEEIITANIPEIDYWQTINEPTPYWDRLPNIRTFTNKWMQLADKNLLHKYKCAILAWSVGNPDLPKDNPMIYWEQFYDTLRYAQNNNHIAMVHQYQKPNLINGNESDDWLVFRLERKVLPNLIKAGFGNLKFVIGELGVDFLIDNGTIGGFKKSLSDQDYSNQLLKWEGLEQPYRDNILGGCIFTLGTQPPWDSYSISSNSNVISLLSTHYKNNESVYDDSVETNLPYIPNEGNETMPNLQWDQRLTARGTKYELSNSTNEYYKLVKGEYLDEKEHIFVNVLDENGNHQYGVTVTVYWNDGEANLKTENKSNDPYALADMNFRMDNLGCSYNIKLGAWSDKVLCEGLGSDIEPNYKIHRSGRYTFQRTKPNNNVEPEPIPDPVETYLPYVPNENKTGQPYTVIANLLNVREAPNNNSKIVARIKQDTSVIVSEIKNGWAKVGNNAWVSTSWIKSNADLSEPPTPPVVNPPSTSKDSIGLNEFKLLLARVLDIDLKLVNAVLQIESGNQFSNHFNKPVIRTELHLAKNCLPASIFNKHFRILGPKSWEGHEYRENEGAPWKKFHGGETGGGQDAEYKVHELVKSYNRKCAFESMSMGAPQILGSNYHLLDYASAEDMYNDFANSNAAQIAGMFGYITSTDGWAALKAKDMRRFFASYNGPGNVDYYMKLYNNYIKNN